MLRQLIFRCADKFIESYRKYRYEKLVKSLRFCGVRVSISPDVRIWGTHGVTLEDDVGINAFTLGAKESGARVDQMLLTTDRQKEPQDIYRPTPDLLVIDKPAGMAVHPGTGTPAGTTLIERVLQELGVSGSVFQPALAHRLDRGTSGVVIVAKTRRMLLEIQRQIQDHSATKEYMALVEGVPSHSHGVVNDRLERVDSRDRGAKSLIVKGDDRGQEAETRWKVRRRYRSHTLMEVKILSGRMHQIRAHMASIGHPVAGDDRYGTNPFPGLKRPFLHAARLGLRLWGREVHFESPLPRELELALERLEAA